ncbi:hypothetical protein [uncultured Sphingomonas sp.]|uniref:hypothetical protein n=1 Tax=uncultured Sphingomonas sp. TaxID=158754 RepID=UPI0035CB8C49
MLPLLTISGTMLGFPFLVAAGLVFSTALRSSVIAFGWEGITDYLLLLPRVERQQKGKEARRTFLVRAAPFVAARLKQSGYYDDPAVAAAVASAIAGSRVGVEELLFATPSTQLRASAARLAVRLAANLYWLLILSIAVPAFFVTAAALYGLLKAFRLI